MTRVTCHVSRAERVLLQTQIIRVEEEKEKVESELLRQARDLEMLQNTIQKSQRERENMQSEMEVLLDRINKMSDMLDKSRVSFPSGLDFQTKLEDCSYFVVHFP